MKHWRVSMSIGSIKTFTFTVNHINVTAGRKTIKQEENNLAFKYLVDIFVARMWLSTFFLFLFFFLYFRTIYRSLVEQPVCRWNVSVDRAATLRDRRVKFRREDSGIYHRKVPKKKEKNYRCFRSQSLKTSEEKLIITEQETVSSRFMAVWSFNGGLRR